MPVCVKFSGLVETSVRELIFEIGVSALASELVTAEEYIAEISTRGHCAELISKELSDIALYHNSIQFSLVEFPRGNFYKAHTEIFSIVRKLGYENIIIDDYSRAGKDIWKRYGFSGEYLSNTRVKKLF